jgi:hypothetical protein
MALVPFDIPLCAGKTFLSFAFAFDLTVLKS